jgi:hypothetical protein
MTREEMQPALEFMALNPAPGKRPGAYPGGGVH